VRIQKGFKRIQVRIQEDTDEDPGGNQEDIGEDPGGIQKDSQVRNQEGFKRIHM